MMAAILNTAMLDSDTLLSSLRFTQKHPYFILTLTQPNSIWSFCWWQPSWIVLSWIQPFCTKLWLKLIQSDSNSFFLTQLDDVCHLEFCHLGFSHFEQKNHFTHSFWLNLMMAVILNSAILNSVILDSTILNNKKLHLFILNSTWWWQPSWILPSWIQQFCTKKLHSFIVTQLDDGSHLELWHVGLSHCHLGFKHLVIFSQIHSKTLSLHSDYESS